jgi:hypothetical protein
MLMTAADLKRIVQLLGATGSAAGLRASEMSLESLRDLATKVKLTAYQDITREELIDRLVESAKSTDIKPIDDLMQMTYDELIQYFADTAPSSITLLNIMKELNYKVSAEDKKHLRKFVARQISETALFSRVASRDEHKESRDEHKESSRGGQTSGRKRR